MLKCMKYKFSVLEKYFLKISKNPQHFLPRWILKTRYISAKASAFTNCQGEFEALTTSCISKTSKTTRENGFLC